MDAAFRAGRADIVPTPAGQIAGMIKDLKSAKQVIEEMAEGAEREGVLAGLRQVVDGLRGPTPSERVARILAAVLQKEAA